MATTQVNLGTKAITKRDDGTYFLRVPVVKNPTAKKFKDKYYGKDVEAENVEVTVTFTLTIPVGKRLSGDIKARLLLIDDKTMQAFEAEQVEP